MSSRDNDGWKELASRGTDGLMVSLLWSKATDQIRVTVADDRFDEAFDLNVPAAHALAAFCHPFAYAVVRDLGFARTTAAAPDLQPQVERSSV